MTASDPSPVTTGLDRPIVSTQWLADHLGSDNLVVLDASVVQITGFDGKPAYLTGHDQYLVDGHIPGAVFADLLEAFSDPAGKYGFARPSAEQFEEAAAAVGVDNHTAVVVYDSGLGQWAARIWWLFRAFGYDDVAVLDGGLGTWRAESRPLDRGHVSPREVVRFQASERADSWVGKDEVARIAAGEESGTLVCALPYGEFTGETGHRPRPGHIPGSMSVSLGRLRDRETGTVASPDALRAAFAPVLENGSRVVTYCAAGIASAADALALTLLGVDDVTIYDGSLNEWVADPEAPLATGA